MAIKIKIESDNVGNELISSFAYNTGKVIEDLINQENNNLKFKTQELEAKILVFYQELSDENIKEKFKNHFNIQISNGK